ncbi:MAG: helix-turn-helix domain-containing protein [Betaproteobacteria bacterium]|nr:helix-turn-helix domain-containing protein [Betaproteobacteria bacterium]
MRPAPVKPAKARKLAAAGWRVGTAREFLGLSEDEARLVSIRLALVDAIRKARARSGLSQVALAERMSSSQSRVAKIEAGDPSVSLDLIIRALIASDASDLEIGAALGTKIRGSGRSSRKAGDLK